MKCPFCQEELKPPFLLCDVCGWRKDAPTDLLKNKSHIRKPHKSFFFGDRGLEKKTEEIINCPLCQEELKSPFSLCDICGWKKETPIIIHQRWRKDTLPEEEYPKRKEELYKLLVFGDRGTGKKTFLDKYAEYKLGDTIDTKRRVGVSFLESYLAIDGKRVKLQIWEMEEMEEFTKILPMYAMGSSGGLFIYDTTNFNSLIHLDDWLSTLKGLKDKIQFPIIAVGNKADLLDHREVPSEVGINIAKESSLAGFIECSSKTGENVEEAIFSITRLMMSRVQPEAIKPSGKEIIICNYCGTILSSDYAFCNKCGSKL